MYTRHTEAVFNGHLSSLLFILMAAMTILSCGSERSSSGVWRDDSCTDNDPATACPPHVYELHLGRYGNTVTGILVKYRAEDGLDPYQRTNVCGCYFIESGRAGDDTLEFRIFSPVETCSNMSSDADEPCDACDCQAPRFKLNSQDDDVLTGFLQCPGKARTANDFTRSSGRVRTTCKDLTP